MANKISSARRLRQAIMLALLCLAYIPLKAQTNGPITLSSSGITGTYSSNRKVTLAPGFRSTPTFRANTVPIDCIPLTTAPSIGQNYIITNVPRISGITSEGQLANRGTCELQQSIQYVDGLGRPVQSIQVMGTPFAYDLVQPIAYDQYGREVKKYLPYVTFNGTAGTYRADALTGAQTAFYQQQDDKTGIVQIPTATQVAYAETLLENSPLGRPLQQGSPGLNNQINGGHTVTTDYKVNTSTDAVKMWQVDASGGASYSTTYAAGSLAKTIVMDENQNNNAVIQFKDKEDRVISRWVQKDATHYLVTDYIYDDLGHLRYVVPPLPGNDGATGNTAVSVPTSFTESDNVFNNFFYGYHYDGLDRPTEKKIPGQGWQYIVYNNMDQPVLTQDANQRTSNIWMVTKYDALGRVVQTGEYYSATATRNALQTAADGYTTNLYEAFTNATTNFGYTHVSSPDISSGTNNKVLTTHYFDNYDIITNTSVNPGSTVFTAPNPAIDSLDKAPRSLAIATLTNVLGSSNYLFSLMHYDKDGRAVKVISQHYQGGSTAYNKYDTEESLYSFQSLALQSTRRHYLPTGIKLTINNWTAYDHSNRPLLTKQQYITPSTTGAVTTLSKISYNELGQAMTKHLGSTNTATVPDNSTFIQHIDFRYNAKGLLTRINNPNTLTDEGYAATTDVFAEQLDYDQNNTGYSFTPNYNSNISALKWQNQVVQSSGQTAERKGFVYTYDAVNRLTNAASRAASSGDNLYNEALTYDDLGNILTLTRNKGTGAPLNKMYYSYMWTSVRSNQLHIIADNGTVAESQATTYTYNTNGSLTNDTKKGVTNIVYNELNLPQTVTVAGTPNKTLSYVYDAAGTKLERIITLSSSVTEDRFYVGGIEYISNTIDFIHTPEGRVVPPTSNGDVLYEYNATDHLGNIRVVFGDGDRDGALEPNEILQTNDYYAFGREIAYSGAITPSPDNQYKYNGKEYQSDLGEYDYGARFYDGVIGRWNVVDPMAEQARGWTPYRYGFNNPVTVIDPDGMFEWTGGYGDKHDSKDDTGSIEHYGEFASGSGGSNGNGGSSDSGPPKSKSSPFKTYFKQLWEESKKFDIGQQIGQKWEEWTGERSTFLSDLGESASSFGNAIFTIDGWKKSGADFKTYWNSTPQEKAKMDAAGLNSLIVGFGSAAPLGMATGGYTIWSLTTHEGFLAGSLTFKTPIDLHVGLYASENAFYYGYKYSTFAPEAFGGTNWFARRMLQITDKFQTPLGPWLKQTIPKGTPISVGIVGLQRGLPMGT